MTFSGGCGTHSYYESYEDGGFIYNANSAASINDGGCCYDELHAANEGALHKGSGTFTSTCTTNHTDNAVAASSGCGEDEYLDGTCKSN